MDTGKAVFLNNELTRIGFGCWQLAGAYDHNGHPNGYGDIDLNDAVKAIHFGMGNGISFFDTAISYGYGKSETELGKALRSFPGYGNLQPVVCTKFGILLGEEDKEDFSGSNITKSVEGSLQRLRVDCLGVMLLHNPPDNFNFAEYDHTPFVKLVEQGKIMAYGVSCRSMKGVANVIKNDFGTVIEAVYNPLDRRYEQFFSDPGNNKYQFICRVPFASGFISPLTLLQDRSFPDNDIRNNINPEQAAWVTDSVRRLSFLNDLEGGITVSALRFQLSNPFGTIAIPGIKNLKQAQDAVLALQLGALPQDVLDEIAVAVPEVFYKWR